MTDAVLSIVVLLAIALIVGAVFALSLIHI